MLVLRLAGKSELGASCSRCVALSLDTVRTFEVRAKSYVQGGLARGAWFCTCMKLTYRIHRLIVLYVSGELVGIRGGQSF